MNCVNTSIVYRMGEVTTMLVIITMIIKITVTNVHGAGI